MLLKLQNVPDSGRGSIQYLNKITKCYYYCCKNLFILTFREKKSSALTKAVFPVKIRT